MPHDSLLLLAAALAPGVALLAYFYLRDAYDREPLRRVLICFLWGAAAVLPALAIERWLIGIGQTLLPDAGIALLAWRAFIVAGVTEESAKFLVVRRIAYPRPEFSEPMDGIVYTVATALGLATVENIMYVFSGGMAVALVRAFLSVPGHALYAVVSGYAIGRAKFAPPLRRFGLQAVGLTSAIVLHGTFNLLLFTGQTAIAALVVPLSIMLWVGALRRIRRALSESPLAPRVGPPGP